VTIHPDLRLASRSPSLEDRADDDLMILARAGAADAFSSLAARHMARVVNYCARLTRDPRVAEELAQETWIALWTARQTYEPRGRFVVWMYTAARRRCLNHLRSRRAQRFEWSAHEVDEVMVTTPDQVDALLQREGQRRVHAALASLPEPLREAVLMRFSEGLRYDEMSAILEAGESTIRSRVYHGLRRLRGALAKGDD
jgi:RNA polymerase sigma-70 factor (ECF subfamily)